MATIVVLDGNGNPQTIQEPLAPGAALAVASVPVAVATDQLSLLSTAANQATEITALQAIETSVANIPASPATAGNQTTANASLATIATNTGAATPAGTNKIGQVAIDQTTPGSTNGVQLTLGIPGQRTKSITFSISRPANTTAYAANQNISTATSGLTAFPTVALGIGNSTPFTLTGFKLVSSNGAASTKLQSSVVLWGAASPSGGGFNDASASAVTAAAYIATTNASVPVLPSTIPLGTASYGIMASEISRAGATDSSGNVYVQAIAQNAYVPASAETLNGVIDILY